MKYGDVIELDRVTLEDCIELYEKKDKTTTINDGRISEENSFVYEEKEDVE